MKPTPDKLILSAQVVEGGGRLPSVGRVSGASATTYLDDTEAVLESAVSLLQTMGWIRETILAHFAEMHENEFGGSDGNQ